MNLANAAAEKVSTGWLVRTLAAAGGDGIPEGDR